MKGTTDTVLRTQRLVDARTVVRYVVLVLVSCVFIVPVLWMISGSLKDTAQVLNFPPKWIPDVIHWENYVRVFTFQPLGWQLLNSCILIASICLITAAVSIPAGYSFARFRIPGGSVLFVICLCAAFAPPETTIIPLFQIASKLGWSDSLLPMIVFTPFLATVPLGTFIMRQAFVSLPKDFGESGLLDGAGRWRIFLQLYLPLVRPSIAALTVFSAWYSWNAFLQPLVYIRSPSRTTASVGLSHYSDPSIGPIWDLTLAASVVSVIPVIVVFIFAQRHIVSGLTLGGVK